MRQNKHADILNAKLQEIYGYSKEKANRKIVRNSYYFKDKETDRHYLIYFNDKTCNYPLLFNTKEECFVDKEQTIPIIQREVMNKLKIYEKITDCLIKEQTTMLLKEI